MNWLDKVAQFYLRKIDKGVHNMSEACVQRQCDLWSC